MAENLSNRQNKMENFLWQKLLTIKGKLYDYQLFDENTKTLCKYCHCLPGSKFRSKTAQDLKGLRVLSARFEKFFIEKKNVQILL